MHRTCRSFACLALVAGAGIVAPLTGQSSPSVVVGEQKINESVGGFVGPLDSMSSFGNRLARLHDLDGNGVDDLAVGAAFHDDSRGAVWILRLDAQGTVIGEQQISEGVGGFDATLPFGNTRFGVAVAPLGDFDGDGVDDVAVGSEIPAQVWILLLEADGTVKSWIEVPLAPVGIGGGIDMSLAAVGDLDGNGAPDLLFGSPFSAGFMQGSSHLLYLGTDGSLLATLQLGTTTVLYPLNVGSVGDLDGNGVIDVGLMGRPELASTVTELKILFLAADGSVLSSQLVAEDVGGFLGAGPLSPSSVTSVGDFDHDGVPDLLVGCDQLDGSRGGAWLLYMQANGTVRSHDRIGAGDGGFGGVLEEDDFLGRAVTSLGDLDGDGTLEVAVGAPGDGRNGLLPGKSPGAAWILSLDDTWFDEGHGLPGVGGTPLLAGTGSLLPGSPGELKLSAAKPGAPGTLHVSLVSTPVAFKGGVLVAFPPILNLPLVTGADGTLALPFVWPAGLPVGTPVWLQASIKDAAAVKKVSLSHALKAVQP